MQQEKIVLPKFTVPGQTNWVKWALVGVGGLVALSVVLFTVALSKRPATDPVATAAPKAADVALAPSATPRPVKPNPTLAATATAAADVAPATEEGQAAKAKAPSHHARRTHATRKTLAKASSGGSTGASKPGKSDPLDDILKRFK